MSEEEPPASTDGNEIGAPRGQRAATGFASETDVGADPAADSSASTPSSAEDATVLMTPSSSTETIGDFEIRGKLGQGGMGAVYRARQITLDRMVALKVLPESLEADETFVTRFQREARIAASLNHRNLVRVYSSGQADGCHYIAMELVEGETLGQWLKRGALPPPEALRVCLDVARALAFGWQHAHLIHRDIKPGNIFLSQEGEVKVGDLGLAKSMSSDTTGLTHTGTAMGTPHYISPEQARGEKDLDFRADIYSLGCTLYQMLTGRTPYDGRDPLSVMHQHINAPAPAILKVLPQCPIPLARLVGKMLKKAKRERQASYEELIAQIESVQELFAPAGSALESILPHDPDATHLATPGAMATPRSVTPVTAPIARPMAATRKSPAMLYGGVALSAVVLCAAAFLLWPRAAKQKRGPATAGGRSAASPAATIPAPAAAWTDLIALIDPPRDGITGGWKIEDGHLICAKGAPWGLCLLPVDQAPANFDLRYRVTRGEGSGIGMFFPFRRGEMGGDVIFDYGSADVPKWGGLEMIGSNRLTQTGKKRDMWLPQGQECIILVQVRDEGVAVLLNGEEVIRWAGDWSEIRQRGGVENDLFRKVGDRKIFGVGLFNSQAVYRSIEMRAVSGEEGRRLPAKPAESARPASAAVKSPAPSATASPSGAPQWLDMLHEGSGKLSLTPGARIIPEGLRLENKSAATVRLGDQVQNDGALRMRLTSDGSRPQLTVRSNSKGTYNLSIKNSETLWLNRFDHALAKSTVVKEFPITPPLAPGRSFEIEIRVTGSTFTAKLDGEVIGSAEDTTFPGGSFAFANFSADSPVPLLESAEFLDLDTAPKRAESAPPRVSAPAKPEPWVDALGGAVPLILSGGAVIAPDGLQMPKTGKAFIESSAEGRRDGAVRARFVFEEIAPQLTVRAGSETRFNLAIRDAKTVRLTRWEEGPARSTTWGEFAISPPLTRGRMVELELRAEGKVLTVKLNGATIGTAEENTLSRGMFGLSVLGLNGDSGLVSAMSFLDLDALGTGDNPATASAAPAPPVSATAARESWQEVLRDAGKILLSGDTKQTPQGLLLSRNGAVTVKSSSKIQRNGAVRMRFAAGQKPPRMGVRATVAGNYYLEFKDPKTMVLCRWERDTGKTTVLKAFNVTPALAPGRSVELELRAVGHTLSVTLDGGLLGTIEDGVMEAGSFGVNNGAPDAQPTVIQGLGFLDLDGAGR